MNVMLAGVAVGIAGSAHCLAMCGPLLAAVAPRGRRLVAHHAGRGIVYIVIGVAAGLAGAGMHAAGVGRWWAFALAIVLLLQAASTVLPFRIAAEPLPITRMARRASAAIRTWATRHPSTGALAVGAMNGLLPCGLIYGAATAAAGFGSLSAAVMFMAGVAIGTTPALTAWSLSCDRIRVLMPSSNRFTPLLLVLLAALLIARGLQEPAFTGHVH
jgi:sulfite exporter TauE/SafE